MATPLESEATRFLGARFPRAVTLTKSPIVLRAGGTGGEALKTMSLHSAIDQIAGAKQMLLAVPELGSIGEVRSLALQLDELKRAMDEVADVGSGNANDPHGNMLFSSQMVWSRLVVLFTDQLRAEPAAIRADFADIAVVQIVDSKARAALGTDTLPTSPGPWSSVFISYGGPDAAMAGRINAELRSKGVRTWFFPKDAIPGDKIHRTVSDGVNAHDRVLERRSVRFA